MSKKLYPEEDIQAIADAIRAKNGSTSTYKSAEMATAIESITTEIFPHAEIPEYVKSEAIAVAAKIVSYTNQVPISTGTDDNVFNGTGYKDGYRINSSGEEAALSGFTTTGFIPFTKGQTIRIGGEGITFDAYGCMLMFYDDNKKYLVNTGIDYNNVGKETYGTWTTEENSVFCLDPLDTYPTDGPTKGYIRVSAKGSGTNLIVTLDQAID